MITCSCESTIKMSLEKTNPTAAKHPILGLTLDCLVQKVHWATCSLLQILLKCRNEATFQRNRPLLGVICDTLAFPKDSSLFSQGCVETAGLRDAAHCPLISAACSCSPPASHFHSHWFHVPFTTRKTFQAYPAQQQGLSWFHPLGLS